ncbi:MAG: DNA-directed RNA polymerase subunit omega [Candidatus Hydrogenedentes bacterium]|nr:DNA-directed RNA polymerase subunit omega [Candidatus Hydrogenedentota bacterium]
MPTPFYVDDFAGKIDSLYRLVIIGSRRANQINKNESHHGFAGANRGKKSTIMSLEEVLQDKLGFYKGEEEEEYLE